MSTGAELFIDTACGLGIDTVFTLVGDHLNEVLAVAAARNMRIVDMRHESGVTHAADAWARIHRKPALSLVTGGPGHTNSLTGIATANLACSPLIAVSGSRPSAFAGRGAFQDIDQVAMARPVTKWSAEPPSATRIPFYLRRAYEIANAGRKGAVHLTIPVDLFRAQAGGRAEEVSFHKPAPAPDVREALAMLREAERPVVIAGSGVWWAGAEDALRRFVEHTSLPLYTITMGRGTVSDDHPLSMGYADPALNYAVHTAFREADVVLVIGKRIDYRLSFGASRLFSDSARFIQVDLHRAEFGLNREISHAVSTDARLALLSMLDEAGSKPWPTRAWLQRVRELQNEWQRSLAAHPPPHPASFFQALKTALPPDVLYSWDGGDFAHWGRAILPARNAGGWLRLGPLGTIGSSLPNALALQLAHPGRRIVAITGDGALGFYLAEMETAVRHGLPIVLIVGNDAGWGLERELQSFSTSGAPTVACELRETRYDQIMQGFGGAGEFIEHPDQVPAAVGRAFASTQPYCIDIHLSGVRSPFTEWQIAGKSRTL